MLNLNRVCLLLVLIGALNWGLYGLFGLDLVEWLLGDMTMLSRLVYILVGASAVVIGLNYKKMCNIK